MTKEISAGQTTGKLSVDIELEGALLVESLASRLDELATQGVTLTPDNLRAAAAHLRCGTT